MKRPPQLRGRKMEVLEGADDLPSRPAPVIVRPTYQAARRLLALSTQLGLEPESTDVCFDPFIKKAVLDTFYDTPLEFPTL